MKYYIATVFSIFLTVCLGCSDFFETDISQEEVILLAPVDNQQSDNTSITFWWEHVNYSTEYVLQIVSPDFNAIESLVLDSAVSETKYETSLSPGTYQWRVKAKNGTSETEFSTRSLVITEVVGVVQ